MNLFILMCPIRPCNTTELPFLDKRLILGCRTTNILVVVAMLSLIYCFFLILVLFFSEKEKYQTEIDVMVTADSRELTEEEALLQ